MREDAGSVDPSSEASGCDEGESNWIDKHPSKTFEAVPPNEVTAGLNVTLCDLGGVDGPLMVELDQHFPEEDDQEGKSVYIHGEHAILQTIRALSDALSDQFEEVPWDDV